MPAIISPLPQWFDLDGSPLSSGYIYFGTANGNPETAPIAVYWDSALTQPAAQPLRTSNGYIVRAGTPAQVYAGSDFSLTVKTSRGERVLYAASSYAYADAAALRADLADTASAAKGAALSGFNAALAYASGTVGYELLKFKSVFATGVAATDTAALSAAIAALPSPQGGTIHIFGAKLALNAGFTNNTKPLMLRGMGNGVQPGTGTIIEVAAGITPFTFKNGASGFGSYCGLEDLHLVSLSAGAGSDDGVLVQALARIRNCTFEHFGGRGVHVKAGVGGTVSGENANNSVIDSCRAYNNFGDGFFTEGVDANQVTFIACDASSNGGWGFYDKAPLGSIYVSPHAASNGLGKFRWGTDSSRSTVIGGYCETDGLHPAIQIDADSVGGHDLQFNNCDDTVTDSSLGIPSRITLFGSEAVNSSTLAVGSRLTNYILLNYTAAAFKVPTTVVAAGGFSSTETGTGTSKYAVRGYSSGAAYTGQNFYSNSVTAAGTGWNHILGQSSNGTVTDFKINGLGNIYTQSGIINTVSDAKTKDRVSDAPSQLTRFMRMKIRNYYRLLEPGVKRIGWVSQELENVYPDLVSDDPDIGPDGIPTGDTTKVINTIGMIPIIAKVVQEQQALIEALTARVAALESRP